MKRFALIVALACALMAVFATRGPASRAENPPPPARIGPGAVWNPSDKVVADVRAKCGGNSDSGKLAACLLSAMQAAGASAEAVAFSKSFAPQGDAYLRAFRDTGKVGIAYVEYLFRANEMEGVFLVNGAPPMLDVDSYEYPSQKNLLANADYVALEKKYPKISAWPGDRFHTEFPAESPAGNGGQEFTVDYFLQDGCHACARVGKLAVSFVFDSSGQFLEARVVKVQPLPGGGAD